VAAVASCAAATRAAAPVLDYLYPCSGQRGTTVALTAGGKFEKWPVQAWADATGLKVQLGSESGKLSIQIDKDTPPGPHLLRLYNAEGASALRVFIVGSDREVADAEPNDEIAKAQAVDALPVTVNGRLEKSGDVDSYSVKLDAGQCLAASVKGRRLGAPMDPMLHLFDSSGNEVAFVHDGLGLDPLLVYRAEKAGTYVVRVSAFAYPPAADVKLTGKAEDVYRLHLSAWMPARCVIPAGVRRGSKATVAVVDWGGSPSPREVDATAVDADQESLFLPATGLEETFHVELSDGPELTEAEAKGTSTGQNPAAPFAVTGRLERDGEEDAYRFAAKKGERLILVARSVALASPMDPVLRIEDESGKFLASDDDGVSPGTPGGDAQIQWDPPADGVYRAVVGDLDRAGGPEYVYRLSVRKPLPGVEATVDAEEYRVAPGKPATIKVKVNRSNGHIGGLVVVTMGLPGVTATSADVPDNGGEVALTLTAAADAKAASGPIRVMLLGTDKAHPIVKLAQVNLRRDNSQELVAKTDAIWLTVVPQASDAPAAPKPK